MKSKIVPSLLAADFACLGDQISMVEQAGAEWLHFDVMDGHFVPNLSFGLSVLKKLRKMTDLHLDVHLMISNPDEMAFRYAEAGANSVLFHLEAVRHAHQLLVGLQERGARAGLVLNPHTPVSLLEEVLPYCDMVLIMSVNPGFGGQEFISTSFEKVRKLRTMIQAAGLETEIEIDGGIGPDNVADAVVAGVDLIVAGTAIFGAEHPGKSFEVLKSRAEKAALTI